MNNWHKYAMITLFATSNALCFGEETYETVTIASDFEAVERPSEYRARPSDNMARKAPIKRDYVETSAIDPTQKQAVVIAKTTHILRGEIYEADIVMLNADPRSQYETYVNGNPIKGKYRVPGSSIGQYKYTGYIRERQRGRTVREYPFSGEYTVTEQTATVSADMMNILYAGVRNPISVSAPGYSSRDIEIDCSNSTLVKGNNLYYIIPRVPGAICCVTVYARESGKSRILSKKNFRILPLPTPCGTIKFNDNSVLSTSGKVNKNKMLTAQEISAMLEMDYLDARYVVTGFKMKFYTKGIPVVLQSNSGEITPEMKRDISKLRDQETFYITDIMAKGSDGKTHKLAPIEVTIQEGEKIRRH